MINLFYNNIIIIILAAAAASQMNYKKQQFPHLLLAIYNIPLRDSHSAKMLHHN